MNEVAHWAVSAAIGLALLVWVVVAAAAQLPQSTAKRFVEQRLSRFTLFIPIWTLFAPYPGALDFHLERREATKGSTAAPWIEVDYLHLHSRVREAIWCPERRLRKVGLVACVRVAGWHQQGVEPQFIATTPAFRVLRALTDASVARGGPEQQFRVVARYGFWTNREDRELYRSPVMWSDVP